MPRQCTICSHPQRNVINEAIRTGIAHTVIARDYQVTRDSVRRHAKSHLALTPKTKRPSLASPVIHAPTKRPQGVNIPDDLREQIQQDFLDAFVLHGIITRACQEVGIHRSILRRWEEHDEAFALAYNLAKEKVNDLYRDEARRRAVEGVETYVVSQGKVVFVEGEDKRPVPLIERKYSDTMLQFIMKARMPEYREKSQVDVTSNGMTVGQSNVTPEVIASMQERILAGLANWQQGHNYHDDLDTN